MSKSAKRSNNIAIGASAKGFCRRKGHRPKVSEFLTEISGGPFPVLRWKVVFSAVEMKRKLGKSSWAVPEVFSNGNRQVSIMQDVDLRLNEELVDSQPTTCKVNKLP